MNFNFSIIKNIMSLINIRCLLAIFVMFLFQSLLTRAEQQTTFKFEGILSLEDMKKYLDSNFSIGSSREELRSVFVTEGDATLIKHPTQTNIEKYIYDINLCSFYIWRWNISTDYDNNGKLLQAYINGDIVFPNGKPKRDISKGAGENSGASIFRVQRPRPEATKGESSLGFLLFDLDSNLDTIDDQALMGAGPSRADPINMGAMHVYTDIDPWCSIFDFDNVNFIAPYNGNCP